MRLKLVFLQKKKEKMIKKKQANSFKKYSKREKILSISFIIIALSYLTSCGNSGCKYPEEQDGIWEQTMITTVRPLNRLAIKQENQFGEYMLKDGTDEIIANENLWTPMKMANGEYAILNAGNSVRFSVDNSIILSGYTKTLTPKLSDWLTIDGSFYQSDDLIKKKHNLSSSQPATMTKKITYEQDGRLIATKSFKVVDKDNKDYEADIENNVDGAVVDTSGTCEPKNNNSIGDTAINYIIYFPDRLVMEKFPFHKIDTIKDENSNVVYTKKTFEIREEEVIVYPDTNDLQCFPEAINSDLYYVCTFTYDNHLYEYRRRVVPFSNGTYAGYEEQIISRTNELKYNTISANTTPPSNPTACAQNCNQKEKDEEKLSCLSSCKIPDSNTNTGVEVDKDSKEAHYAMCISPGNNASDSGMSCGNFSGKNNYGQNWNHIVYTKICSVQDGIETCTYKSPIKLFFKSFDEIYGNKSTTTYNFSQCFQSPTSFYYGSTYKTNSETYKNRFMSEINNITCSDGKTLHYAGNCRVVPKRIKYQLHDITGKLEFRAKTEDLNLENEDEIFISQSEKNRRKEENTKKKNRANFCNNTCNMSQSQYFSNYINNSGCVQTTTNSSTFDVAQSGSGQHRKTNCVAATNPICTESIGIHCSKTSVNAICTGTTTTHNSSHCWLSSQYTQIVNNQLSLCYDTIYDGNKCGMPCTFSISCQSCLTYNQTNEQFYDTIKSQCLNYCNSAGTAYHDLGVVGDVVTIDSPEVVSWIDYETAHNWNTVDGVSYKARMGANYNDPNNTFYYVLVPNTYETIQTSIANLPLGSIHADIDMGLLPIADLNSEILEVECYDGLLPNVNLLEQEAIYSQQSNVDLSQLNDNERAVIESSILDSTCKVSGSYNTYESTGKLKFSSQKRGIIPIQWSSFSVGPNKTIPINISTAYPVKVKSKNCINDKDANCYLELYGGNGLAIYAIPNDDNGPGTEYTDPDMWQCNMGVAGSYGLYHPYDYDHNMTGNGLNPREITTSSNLWWTCDDGVPMWFSGYDFLNVKSGKPINFHIYNTDNLQLFLPAYEEPTSVEPTVDDVGCNEDGIPSSMKINGILYTRSEISGISYDDFNGASFVYSTNDGISSIGVYDANVTDKVYETFKPKMIVVNLEDLNLYSVTITTNQNKLDRIAKDGKQYYYFIYDGAEYNIPIESNKIITASCYADGEEPDAKKLSEEAQINFTAIKKLTFEENSKYYSYDAKNKTIFTRYGPFTGFQADTTGILLPSIYQTYGMCRGGKEENNVPDSNDVDFDGNSTFTVIKGGEQFIYDEQHEDAPANKNLSSYIGYPDTNTPRKKLENSWRIEFTTPTLEYKQTINSDNTDGVNAYCTNGTHAVQCESDSEPDIMIVDLSATNQNVEGYSGTTFITRERNNITIDNLDYYDITTNFNDGKGDLKNYKLTVDNPMVERITCDGFTNCNKDEIPIIELTYKGIHRRLVNGDTATISTRKSNKYYTFYYDQKTFTIPADKVYLQDTICLSSSIQCKSYLEPFISHVAKIKSYIGYEKWKGGKYGDLELGKIKSKNNTQFKSYFDEYLADPGCIASCVFSGSAAFCIPLCQMIGYKKHYTTQYQYSLGKAPYFLSCGGSPGGDYDTDAENRKVNEISVEGRYRVPYAANYNVAQRNNNDYDDSIKNNILSEYSSDKDIKNSGIVMQSNIKNFVNKPTFARCVPYWTTPQWMLMSQPGDPSSFPSFSAISGSYFSEPGKTLTANDVKAKYKITSVWQKYGGIIKNAVVNQTCATEISSSGKANVNSICIPKSTSTFNASFKTIYPKQFLFIKSLINDPVNTHDDICTISANGATAQLKMNDPFGSNIPSAVISGVKVDKSKVDSLVSGVQATETTNGDGTYGNEFFKLSEMHRNLTGAGFLHPNWQIMKSGNNAKIFDAGATVSFSTSGSYYVTGNLSHKAQAYCSIKNSTSNIERETAYGTALGLATAGGSLMAIGMSSSIFGIGTFLIGSGLFFGAAPGMIYAALNASNNKAGGANTKGTMLLKKPDYAKRDCGIATSFRVVPIPPFACLAGYSARCSNNRINTMIDRQPAYVQDTYAVSNCLGEKQTDFQSDAMNVGRCYKRKYNILTGEPNSREATLRYKDGTKKYLNTLIELASENINWSEDENIYEKQCGLCVNTDKVYSYNGISFLVDDAEEMPKAIRTEEHCRLHTNDNGDRYKWITNFAKVTPFEHYPIATQNEIINDIASIFQNKLLICEPTSTYYPSVTKDENRQKIKNAFLKASIRDHASCTAQVMSLFATFISETGTTEECLSTLDAAKESLASGACYNMRAIIEAKDGTDYERYFFTKNIVSGVCTDDKTIQTSSTKSGTELKSLTRIDNINILQKDGYGELSTENAANEDGSVDLTITMPEKLYNPVTKKIESYKSARIGFVFAGVDDSDIMNLYKDYRVINSDDLQRGYNITIGNGNLLTKGKYLYYYIQPLNDAGEPDPSYDPNKIFSPSKGITKEQIIADPRVYSFKDNDTGDTGTAKFIANRTGKLWFAILDQPDQPDGDSDGMAIEFATDNSDGSQRVNGDNYLSTNSGAYEISGKIQTETLDAVTSIIQDDSASGSTFVTKTLFGSIVITPIKQLLLGSYNSDKKTYNWDEGLINQIASAFLKIHLVYIAWFIFLVLSVFVISFGFITGQKKFDFQFMKKYLWQYALIIAFVNPQSLDLYNRLFVQTAFNLAEGLSAYVVSAFGSPTFTDPSPEGFTEVAFGPVDKILKFWISVPTLEKILAILFSSWTGWISVILLLVCFVFFIISVLEALALYLIILLKMSLFLAVGPLVFLLLLHEKTAGKFTDWWKALAGMIAEQVTMFTAISVFCTIYYHIVKGSMNFVYCWEPVLKIPILDITLFSMWRISGTLPAHMAELMGTMGDEGTPANSKGFNVLTGFILFIITCLMSKFVDKASGFGAGLFGQGSSMPSEIKQIISKGREMVKETGFKPIKGAGKTIVDKASKLGDSEDKEEEPRTGVAGGSGG